MAKKVLTQPLEDWLGTQICRQDADALKPLPATRALGEQFGISHGTVFRLLNRLESEGKVWRHANGRFYPALASRVLGRAKPVAVMLRRMAAWSSLCREVMEGFTDECGERERPVLWFHNKNLVIQPSPEESARIASGRRQRELLKEFELFHGNDVSGVLFDEVWRDEAIRNIFPPSLPMVSFFRPSSLPEVRSAAADFKAGAILAMSHLLANGFEKIYLIDPLPEYEAAEHFLKNGREVYREVAGRELPSAREIRWHDPSARRDFMEKLGSRKHRAGLICPEDNTSIALARELRTHGLIPGKHHGLVSVMGTSALPPGDITCVRYDFRKMGRVAAELLCEGRAESQVFPPTLDAGASTLG